MDAYDSIAEDRAALAAAPVLDVVPRYGSVVIDRQGDAWDIGRTRATCRTQVDGVRILRVARLPVRSGQPFGGMLAHDHGPFKLLREGANGPWLYETIRGRR